MLFWLGTICSGLVGLLILFVTYSVLEAYWRYRRSPAKRWRDRVIRLMAELERRAQAEAVIMERTGVKSEAEDAALRERVFRTYLESISVNELEAYPGIGPATIGKLSAAGYVHLATLDEAPQVMPLLGPKRSAEVHAAVRDVVQKARARFDAGDCAEAHELAVQLAVARASRSPEGFRAARRYLAVLDVMEIVAPLADLAQRIRFSTFVQMGRQIDGVPLPALELLPDLEEVIRQADEEAQQAYPQWQATASGPPASLPESTSRRQRSSRSRPGRTGAPAPRAARVDLFRQELEATPAVKAPPTPPTANETPMPPTEDPAVLRVHLTVQFAFAVARAQGRLNRKQKAVIEQQLQRRWADDRALFNRARAFAAHFETAAIDLDECLRQIAVCFTLPERQALLDFARAIIKASGQYNRLGRKFLDRLSRKLGLTAGPPEPEAAESLLRLEPPAPPPRPAPIPAPATAPPQQSRAVLEIDPSVALTADLVRRQWHALTERYALEKFEALGPEFVTTARGKLDAIHAAATALLAGLGEKLEPPPADPGPQELRHNPDLDAMFGA